MKALLSTHCAERGIALEWPFHPKFLGLITAFVFFALALVVVPYEATAQSGQVLFWTALRTLFAFVGGAGFTGWLSMTIYEYVHRRGQEWAWEREFDVSMVKDLYGPVYDELNLNLRKLAEFGSLDLSATSQLQQKYLSLLVPPMLVSSAHSVMAHVEDYNQSIDSTNNLLQSRVLDFTASFFESIGGPREAPSAKGTEARGLLGALAGPFRVDYERFLEGVKELATGLGLAIDLQQFERNLRSDIQSSSVAKSLFVQSINIRTWSETVITELKPLIRQPYGVSKVTRRLNQATTSHRWFNRVRSWFRKIRGKEA